MVISSKVCWSRCSWSKDLLLHYNIYFLFNYSIFSNPLFYILLFLLFSIIIQMVFLLLLFYITVIITVYFPITSLLDQWIKKIVPGFTSYLED